MAEDRETLPVPPKSDIATITRRVLVGAGLVVFVGGGFGPWTVDKVLEARRDSAEQRKKLERARGLFQQLFGTSASVRHSYDGQHPDNQVAETELRAVLGMYDSEPHLDRDGSMRRMSSFRGDLFLFGGPNSTALTMLVWEFDGPNQRELDRHPDPALPLRFFGRSNERDKPNLPDYLLAYKRADHESVTTIPWPFVDTYNAEKAPIVPKGIHRVASRQEDSNQLPIYGIFDNYLLVTRLQNFLDDSVRNSLASPVITVFSGSNGIGTRAAELLIEPAGLEALEQLAKTLQGATDFQAMFRVFDAEETPDGYHRFRSIELLDWSVTNLKLSETNFVKASLRIKQRLDFEEHTLVPKPRPRPMR